MESTLSKDTEHPVYTDPDRPLLALFLQELNIARRNLNLYPPEHPRITASIDKTLALLNELFHADRVVTLGIAPESIYFEETWLDQKDAATREFARFFSALGIATVSFSAGVSSTELIRFNQLLRSDRNTLEAQGGFEQLLEQQQIKHIQVIPIDYDAFQANGRVHPDHSQATGTLWETFLHGLQHGILDFGQRGEQLDISAIAELLNQKSSTAREDGGQYQTAVEAFVEQSVVSAAEPLLQTRTGESLNLLLEKLTPTARQDVLKNTLQALDRHPEPARNILPGIDPHHFQEALVLLNREELQISSRLVNLVRNFTDNTGQGRPGQTKRPAQNLSGSVVRARLNELFKEEQQERYLPGAYQSALEDIMASGTATPLPEEAKLELKAQLEEQSIERQTAAIIFEMLTHALDKEQEIAVQRHLLELSRFFLDTGDFVSLRECYENWSAYLNSGRAGVDLFGEKLLAAHTQLTFLTEVLDGFELWDEEVHDALREYIVRVGEIYTDLVIERLGQAAHKDERLRWLGILEEIAPVAQEKIIHALEDERWYLIRNLLIALGKERNQATLKNSLKFCDYPHPQVRKEAIRNLFGCNPATANRYLLKELQAADPAAREAAVQLAELSRDHAILALLHKRLEHTPADDEDLELQKKVIATLSRMGQRESLPVLRRILFNQGLFAPRRVKQLQREVLLNLPRFPQQLAAKLLQELSRSRFRKQLQAAQELNAQERP